ncbi:MAG: hypothetical protein QXT57_01795 [Thermosphaera sp.]
MLSKPADTLRVFRMVRLRPRGITFTPVEKDLTALIQLRGG